MNNISNQLRRGANRVLHPTQAAKAPAFASMLAGAYAHAAAQVEAIDALRPNAQYGLHPTPSSLGTKLTAGQAAQCQKITIEAGTTIVGIYTSPYDDANGIVVTSLKFGSTEVCKNGPMPLSLLSDRILRSDRLIPLIGHRLPQALDVQATLFVMNATDQFFRGIGLLVIDGTCRPVTTNAAPAPGFAGFGRIVPYVRNALTQFGPRVIR
jgi:hypothetical protein